MFGILKKKKKLLFPEPETTTRNQSVPSSKALLDYADKLARKRVRDFYNSEKGKKLLEATKIE